MTNFKTTVWEDIFREMLGNWKNEANARFVSGEMLLDQIEVLANFNPFCSSMHTETEFTQVSATSDNWMLVQTKNKRRPLRFIRKSFSSITGKTLFYFRNKGLEANIHIRR